MTLKLDEEFEISDGVVVPMGAYSFNDFDSKVAVVTNSIRAS